MPHTRAEKWLGVGAFLAIVALAWMWIDSLRDRYAPRMYRVTAYFTDARGIAEGTPIRIAGVRAGWVVELIPPRFEAPSTTGPRFDYTRLSAEEKHERVKIVLGILNHIRLRTHKVRVASMGLIQERYLAIDVGQELPVERTGAEVLGELDVSLDTVGDAARRVQAIFGDTELQRRIGGFSENLTGLLNGFDRIVKLGPDALKRAQGTLHTVGTDASSMIEATQDAGTRTQANLDGRSDDLERSKAQIDAIRGHFDALSAAATELEGRIADGKGDLGKFACDRRLADSLAAAGGAKTKLAYDRSRTPPPSKSTRTLLKIAKSVLFFLEPKDK